MHTEKRTVLPGELKYLLKLIPSFLAADYLLQYKQESIASVKSDVLQACFSPRD